MAKKHHPDAASGNSEKFKAAAEAWEILSNEQLKAQYDAGQRATGSQADQAAWKQDFMRHAHRQEQYKAYQKAQRQSFYESYKPYGHQSSYYSSARENPYEEWLRRQKKQQARPTKEEEEAESRKDVLLGALGMVVLISSCFAMLVLARNIWLAIRYPPPPPEQFHPQFAQRPLQDSRIPPRIPRSSSFPRADSATSAKPSSQQRGDSPLSTSGK